MSATGRNSKGWPLSWTDWKHKNGSTYTVEKITNGESDRHDEYPPTVVYHNEKGQDWSRPCSRWTDESFTYIGRTPHPKGLVDVEEVKGLCRDFSSRNGNVYIKDVEASLDGLVLPLTLPKEDHEQG